ncbi:MAG: LacI family DNA-binding transcriptional regulator [Oscillospiraceae bacterium]
MASIKDVAKRAGVSISTVSNVINKSKYVSPELTEKVNQAVLNMQYEADPVARNMKTGKTKTIGIITADLCGLFYPYVIKGIYEIANLKGYSVTIFDTNTAYNQENVCVRELECFKKLVSNRVDGIIFASAVPEKQAKEFLRDVREKACGYKQTPLVSIERDFSAHNIDSVFSDNVEGARKAVTHLLECGCERICHIAGPKQAKMVQDRIEGYRSTMKEHNLDFAEEKMVQYGDYTHQSGYIAMERLLRSNPRLDGVFVANDQMAIGALKALVSHGKRVPQDVKIVGFDNVFISSMVEVPLSTIHIRKRHMGLHAARRLFKKIEEEEMGHPQKEKAICEELETRLVVRRSSVFDATEDWILSDW